MSLPSASFAMRLTDADEGSVHLQIAGEVDLLSAPQFAAGLQEQIQSGKNVILDFSETVFMDSSGLRALIGAIHRCEEHGTTLAVEGEVPHQLRRLFEITHVEAVLPVVSEAQRNQAIR